MWRIAVLISVVLLFNFNKVNAQVLPQYFPFFANSSNDSVVQPSASMYPLINNFNTQFKFAATNRESGTWFNRKLFRENFFVITDSADKFTMTIDPLVNAFIGQDFNADETKNLYQNTRGFAIRGTVGERFGFESFFFENQSFHPEYQDRFIRQFRVAPGMGRTKGFKNTGFDYAQAMGNVNFKVADWLLIRGGTGKHFFGDGYRSMLWSDNTFSYPFLQFSSQLLNQKLQINWLHASLQHLTRIPDNSGREGLFIRKNASVFYIEYQLTNRLRISAFESVMWQRWDSLSVQSFNGNQLVPIPFFNLAKQGFMSENHVLAGLNLAFQATNQVSFYGQLVSDNISENRLGYQIGSKGKNVFFKGFNYLVEFNKANQNIYSSNFLYQYHGHYNQAFAHPLGNNFEELILALYFNPKQWRFLIKNHFITKGNGFSNVVDRNYNLEGSFKVNLLETRVGYCFNPETNLELFVGGMIRSGEDLPGHNASYQYFFMGFATRLFNNYYDF
jgi:hypothetical protein